jgi:hypothetical protein
MQALRASPPGLAGDDRTRRRVFGACLAQFDELMRAAATTSATVSPIPLFYALAQAGRAVAAAHVADRDWQSGGHGLSVAAGSQALGEMIIEPHEGSSNAFGVFSRAIGSRRLTSAVRLADAWAAVAPTLQRVKGLGQDAAAAVEISPRDGPGHVVTTAFLTGPMVNDLPSDSTQAAHSLASRLRAYPDARDGFMARSHGNFGDGTRYVELGWRTSDGRAKSIELVAEQLGPGGGYYLLPALGPNEDVLKPLAAWWVVLLAVSSAARYHPDRWVAALDRDKSLLAIPIEEALATAREILPWLLLDAMRDASGSA